MKLTFFGTRGSIPVAGNQYKDFGGNTTCLGIQSECFPEDFGLCIDSGSGFIPASRNALQNKKLKEFNVLHTHWHHDHTQGMTMSALTFNKSVKMNVWGPVEGDYGPREIIKHLMKPPFFPIDFARVGSHFEFFTIENPDTKIIAIHKTGGIVMVTQEVFERGEGFVSFGKRGTYPVNDCMIVRMRWTNHPERTISYRFEEGPTGQVFVFLTDHENQAELSKDMQRHLSNADLLVMDSQYKTEQYRTFTAGFGHGTPDYCAGVAIMVGAKMLGLTHHAPDSSDENVREIVEDAKNHIKNAMIDNAHNLAGFEYPKVFACGDYMEIDLSSEPAFSGSSETETKSRA